MTPSADQIQDGTASQQRQQQWERALQANTVPDFVASRLKGAGEGTAPWLSSGSAAELLLTRRHGIRPITVVSGTCWIKAGSWLSTDPQGEAVAMGLGSAIARMQMEAFLAGANAIVDVTFRDAGASFSDRDYTVVGTAIKVDGLAPSSNPLIATVGALEFVRLLQANVAVAGLIVGKSSGSGTMPPGSQGWGNQPLDDLTDLSNDLRRRAWAQLSRNAALRGSGVLGHGGRVQIRRVERDNQPPLFMGRAVVFGTIIETPPRATMPHAVSPALSMNDPDTLFRVIEPRGTHASDMEIDEW